MDIVIIEDEMPAFRRLAKLVEDAQPDARIVAHLEGIATAEDWFAAHSAPDMVLMDIHLSDGSAFDLLKRVNIQSPIIFTTAYDEYAVQAFKASSIDYLLKPVKREDLEGAFRKAAAFKSLFLGSEVLEKSAAPNLEQLSTGTYKKRFVIRFGEHIKTLAVEDIAYCYSESKATFARTHDGRNMPMDANLDTLETMLDPQEFFRINRQYLVSLKAIEDMRTYTKARVLIRLNPAVREAQVVSSERAAAFKSWLAGE